MELRGRTGSHGPGRARRFTLHLPVLYRTVGQTGWHFAVTENISDSGAAIRTDESIAPATPLVIVISLPSMGSQPGGRLIAQGRVVRNLTPSSETTAMFALTVRRFQIDRPEDLRETITP